MIETHHVEQGERGSEAIDPPLVTRGGQQVPAINRISPKLSGSAEIIRRYAGNYRGAALIVEIEKFGMGPDVRAVVRNINRDVPHEADGALLAIFLERAPLPKKFELPILLAIQFRPQFRRQLVHSLQISPAKPRIP